MQVGDLVAWTQCNKRRIGIIVADHGDGCFQSWGVLHNGEVTVAREEWLEALSASR